MWTSPTSGKPKASIHESCRAVVRAKPGRPRAWSVLRPEQPPAGPEREQYGPAEVGHPGEDGPPDPSHRPEQGRRGRGGVRGRAHDAAFSEVVGAVVVAGGACALPRRRRAARRVTCDVSAGDGGSSVALIGSAGMGGAFIHERQRAIAADRSSGLAHATKPKSLPVRLRSSSPAAIRTTGSSSSRRLTSAGTTFGSEVRGSPPTERARTVAAGGWSLRKLCGARPQPQQGKIAAANSAMASDRPVLTTPLPWLVGTQDRRPRAPCAGLPWSGVWAKCSRSGQAGQCQSGRWHGSARSATALRLS